MKRFIAGLATAAIISMPMAASALEKMDNSQLKSATGQAGVSIAIDDIVIYQKSLADSTYWDTDAMADGKGAAGIMIDHAEEMQKLMIIDGILDDQNEYSVANIASTFGVSGVGIISQADLGALVQDNVNDFIANNGAQAVQDYLGNAANAADLTTYTTNATTIATNTAAIDANNVIITDNQAIVDEGVGGTNGYTDTDITAAETAIADAEVQNTTLTTGINAAQAENEGIEATAIDQAYRAAFPTGYNTAAFDPTNGNTGNDDYRTGISPLTIDVGTCESLTRGWEYNMGNKDRADIGSVGGVVIGLPTIEITTYNTTNFKTVKLATGEALADGTVDSSGDGGYMNAHHNSFITIEKSGYSQMAILGGRLEIAPH
eukprot:gnl/Chilomastix_cuspidata/3575.p1 GENE.gnl/Chilomastix_cuspidata/3575~~gnl/Chilomastix_cuspidata/3575.p1  ORF type:complete len:376 (-),score=-12.93 gnl/Chilomastix_cuspidata/3575:7-1134(-)